MTKRLLGAALMAVLLVTVVPVAAVAAEAGAEVEAGATPEGGAAEPLPDISEIGTQEAREAGYFPEEYESPAWFKWVLYPTIIIGVLMALGILGYYLLRQPDFAEERKRSSRR